LRAIGEFLKVKTCCIIGGMPVKEMKDNLEHGS